MTFNTIEQIIRSLLGIKILIMHYYAVHKI